MVFVIAVACGAPHAAAQTAETITVVTSFPEELSTRYEREFERKHPDIHIRFVWKQSRDALVELSKPEQGGADVYWAPTIANFALLKERGAFRKVLLDHNSLPSRLGHEQISDPEGLFAAFDVAGYGVVVNPDLLAAKGLAAPKRWRDLAAPETARNLVMPIPGKVGFSPALYDILLQSEGWENGWRLLSEMAGEAALLDQGALPTIMVREAKAALGLTIDFFVVSAKANGASVDIIYPERTAFLPAHIAITAASKHAAAAQTFVDYALSNEGQKLMTERDSGRHPARPDAYTATQTALVDPFKLPPSTILDYDLGIGRRRPPLIVILFDLAIVEGHAESAALWRILHDAEQRNEAKGDAKISATLAEARALLGFIPVSDKEASDPAFLDRFANRDAVDPQTFAKWRDDIAAARAKARALLQGFGAAP